MLDKRTDASVTRARTTTQDLQSPRWTAREQGATRLLRTAAAHSYDPMVDLDWDAPPVPGLPYAPARQCSLYGTGLWEAMTDAQRVELTKHEVASIACTGIWFELILMQMLLRHAYDRPSTSRHVRWTLTEIGDECRHSAMFGRMVATFGCPSYGPGPVVRLLGKLCKATSDSALTFGGTLYVEELLDGLQRACMQDEGVQPLSRAVSRIHVVEEARHIRFARDELRRAAPRLTGARRVRARAELALVAYLATSRLIDPRVYAAVGLNVRAAVAAAGANPHWRETKRAAAAKPLALLSELGLVGGPTRRLWVAAGLLD